MKLRERLQRLMYGRYGVDGLGRFLLWSSIVFLFVAMLTRNRLPVLSSVLYLLVVVLLIATYVRMFSKNIQKRYQENCTYYRYVNICKDWFRRRKSHMQQRKTHHIYSCPSCRQKIRIPKGKGKVAIRCSKCGTEFIRVSR